MMFAKAAMPILIGFLLNGRASSGNYRHIARPIRPSMDDSMTAETKSQIPAENEKLQALCGVKP
ncbi:hypothetical protein [Agrobacterium sp. DSM 25558]|uniref:hypothetical protein n=1 Tax=Agrobacterium sp. DSM 25558 TaxID=1907665 RepID=UPI00097D5C6D|nr:hypothetical protein [Agrobacterium sp. DSM 25558]